MIHDFFLYRAAWRYFGAPDKEPKLNHKEWKELLHHGGIMVRNTYDFDRKETSSFWYVIKDKCEQNELNTRDRNKVRHAHDTFSYELIEEETLREKGYAIIKETYEDYRINDRKMNPKVFETYLNECNEGHFDYWGIIEKETRQLVGFCVVHDWEDCCEYGVTGIRTKYKQNGTYPYYGLYNTMNQYYLLEKKYKYVSDSARTITEHSQIQSFLIQHFNFRKAYCQLEVHYQWWMKMAVKMLYPFRKIITLPRIKAVLNMEAMQRGKT